MSTFLLLVCRDIHSMFHKTTVLQE
uniref:Uncharacterized protein n=1 Tax=Anguilla anguilla TaxID=7936 RepID=A0A0E9Q5X3_ANGAN